MSRCLIVCLVAAIAAQFALLTTPSSVAEEPAVGSVNVIKSESLLCRRLAVNPEDTAQYGYLKMVSAPKGKVFLVVWSQLKLTFAKNEDDENAVYLEDSHISLKDSKGTASYVVGRCSRDGRFSEGSGYVSHYEEYLEGNEVDHSSVFVVDEKERSFTLQMNDHAHKFSPPMQLADTITRTDAAEFKIEGVKVIDDLSQLRSLREYEDNEVEGVQEKIHAPSTRYLAVRFVLKPKFANDSGGEFSSSSNEFGLRYGSQVYVTPIGHFDGRDFYDGGTGEWDEPDAAGEFPAQELHLVFPLPGKLTAFRALYLMQDFGGAAIPQG